MKRTLLAAAALLALSATPSLAESKFDGAYVGGTAAAEATEFDLKAGGVADESAALGLGAGVFGGYGKSLGSFYLGGEAAYDYSGAEYNSNLGGARTQFGFDHTFTFTARAGYLLNSDVLVYGLTGYERAQYKLAQTGVADAKGWVDGVKVGVGAEYAMDKGLFARGEYNRTFSEDFRIGGTAIDADRSQFKLGFGYRF